jgi:hypothetical protein
VIQLLIQHDDPDIEVVWNWYEFQIELLGESRANVIRQFSLKGDIAADVLRSHAKRFIGWTSPRG